ncbi:hypothetical protein ACIRPK_33705 [Kitasatospora sp. NPDC101801]|uniref:hypothetical protein n=1 Tax=Kitasatospora sp. NPDC101801 TaxID=3364103 RepID=UPI0038305C94
MKLYIAIPVLAFSLFFLVTGLAAVIRGWLLPTSRRHVHNPRLHGWGQLLMALALTWQVLIRLAGGDTGPLPRGLITGGGLQLTGLILLFISQRQPRHHRST